MSLEAQVCLCSWIFAKILYNCINFNGTQRMVLQTFNGLFIVELHLSDWKTNCQAWCICGICSKDNMSCELFNSLFVFTHFLQTNELDWLVWTITSKNTNLVVLLLKVSLGQSLPSVFWSEYMELVGEQRITHYLHGFCCKKFYSCERVCRAHLFNRHLFYGENIKENLDQIAM